MADMETTAAQESNLSTWAGPYVTDMLGKAEALAGLPYQPYQGALTSGVSDLQSRAFQGLGALTVPGSLGTAAQQAQQTYGATQQYMPTVGTVQSYMNPYLEAVLEPQRREASRQADIARMQTAGRLSQAGAYGGSRQAIMEAEGLRNLQQQLSDITGKGYASAYDAARAQRQADIDAGLRGLAAQTSATQALTQAGTQEQAAGIQNLQQQLAAGATQRDIEQQGLTADYNQYLRELQYPQQMLEFQRNMIAGLPVASASYYQPAPSAFQSAAGGAGTALELLKILGQLK
jgi:hypothetical protein